MVAKLERHGLVRPLENGFKVLMNLIHTPNQMSQENIISLRQHGITEEDIHAMVQIVAYFNYLTRIADGLGIPPEERLMDPWPREDGQWDTV